MPGGVFNLVTRLRPGRRRGDRRPPRRRHGLVHRLDARRAGASASSPRPDRQEGRARARRQVAERHPRRRRPREGGRQRHPEVLPQQRPDVLRADAHARPARAARRGRADRRGGGRADLHAGRPARRRRRSSGRSSPRSQRERVRGYIEQGDRGGRDAGRRRRRAARGARARLLRAAHRVQRRHARDDDRAARRSSARCWRSCPTRTRRTPCGSPTTRDYGLAGGVWSALRGAREGASRGGSAPARWRSTAAAFNPLAPFGGYKQSGHGRELGPYGIEEFLALKSMQL